MKIRLVLLFLCLFANLTFAEDPDKIVSIGEEVPLSATATDKDCHFKTGECPHLETDTAITITWSAVWKNTSNPAGSFKNDDNEGPSVIWIAPCAFGDVTVTATASNSQSTKAVDGNASDSIWVRVESYANFTEPPSQDYGFDDFSDISYPRKSIWTYTGVTDNGYIEISQSGNDVYLVSENDSYITVSPTHVTSSGQLTITNQDDNPVPVNLNISARCSNPDGETLANMQVKRYPRIFSTVHVHFVENSGNDVQEIAVGQSGSSPTDTCVSPGYQGVCDTMVKGDDYYGANETICVGNNLVCESTANNKSIPCSSSIYPTLDDYLNEIYDQAVAGGFNVTFDFPTGRCSYDRDGSGALTMYYTSEINPILNLRDPLMYDYEIFVVGNIFPAAGFAEMGGDWAIVEKPEALPHLFFLIAHELGHAFGHLNDLDQTVNCTEPGVDSENLMSYCSDDDSKSLRYGQWDTIQYYND